jgi:putative addiction module component (TIGR02574 family)
MSSLKQIEEQARSLSAEERAQLAESMIESLHGSMPDIKAAWDEEIERRVAAFDRGEIASYDGKDVFAAARHIVDLRTLREWERE